MADARRRYAAAAHSVEHAAFDAIMLAPPAVAYLIGKWIGKAEKAAELGHVDEAAHCMETARRVAREAGLEEVAEALGGGVFGHAR